MYLKKVKVDTSLLGNLIIIFIFFMQVISSAPALAAEEATKADGAKNWLPKTSLRLTAGSATEYFIYSGKYLSLDSGFAWLLSRDVGFRVGQGLTKTYEPNEKVDLGDTRLTFSYGGLGAVIPKLHDLRLSIAPSIGFALPLSKRSRLDKLKTRVSSAISFGWSYEKLSLMVAPGYTRYFYTETLNSNGNAFPKEQLLVSLGGTYSLTLPLSVSYSYTPIERTLHEGFRKQYLFQTNAGMNYQAREKIGLFIGVASTNSQITHGERTKFVLYDKEVTEFYVGVGYDF